MQQSTELSCSLFYPQVYLIYTSFLKTSGMVFVKGYSLNSYKVAFNRMGSAIFNTIRIPFDCLSSSCPIRNIYLLPSR